MVLADFSPAIRPEPTATTSRNARGVLITVLAAAAVLVLCVGFTANGFNQPVSDLQTKPIVSAAKAAEATLQQGLHNIKNRNTYQGISLAKAMNQALSAVSELEGTATPQHDVKKLIAAKRVSKHLSDVRVKDDDRVKKGQDATKRLKEHAKMDEAISTDLKLKENGAVRDELRKLVETAKHLTAVWPWSLSAEQHCPLVLTRCCDAARR